MEKREHGRLRVASLFFVRPEPTRIGTDQTIARRPGGPGRWSRGVWGALTLLIAISAFAPVRCAALDDRTQRTQYVQMTLTDRNGLPQNSVDAVAQTTDGYMWFGTQEGLGRFDG